MRILLSFSDSLAMEVVALSLEGQYGLEVRTAPKIDEVIEILQANALTPIDLVFCDHPARSNLVGSLLKQNGLSIPMIVFCADSSAITSIVGDPKILGWVPWSNWTAQIQPLMERMSARPEQPIVTAPDSEFHEIRTELLMLASPLPADVFIRLSHDKHLKIFRAGDDFNHRDYDRYWQQKKVHYFHLRKEGLASFIRRLAEVIVDRIHAGMSEQDATDLSREIHETVRRLVQQGIPAPDTNELIKANLDLTIRAIGRNPHLNGVLGKLMEMPSSYLTCHSVALCQISCTLAHAMGWGSNATFRKLNFASFLHDIVLEDDELARLDSRAQVELLRGSMGDEVADEYLLHGLRSAELSIQFDEVPPDVDQIIMQHHERPDGSGFPRGLTQRHISPLSALFIVAHDLVDCFLEAGERFDYATFLRDRADVYDVGPFRKVMRGIAQLQ